MEFGKLNHVDQVDWTLPKDPDGNQPRLEAMRKTAQQRQNEQENNEQTTPRVYIGAPAWGHKEWVGQIYPPETSPKDFLFHYARNFNCIELNSTHYGIPNSKTLQNWTKKVPDHFLFCPKTPQQISHQPNGLLDAQSIQKWLKALECFGSHLGPSFLQLPPTFSYADKRELFLFLKNWPNDFELAIELRHSSWLENRQIRPALADFLFDRKIGLVITDVAGRRDLLHTTLSSSFSFLRFIGNNLHPSDFERTKTWIHQIKTWQDLGLERFFFMVHEPEDLKTPEMTQYVIQKFNQVCQSGLSPLTKPLC